MLSPRQGETVAGDFPIEVLAQRTLGGVASTAFTVQVDGRPLDPSTGRLGRGGDDARPVDIAVGERARVPVRGLRPGRHRIEVTYRPDADEPPRTTTVAFEVAGPERPEAFLLAVALATIALVGLGLVMVSQGRRRAVVGRGRGAG